MFSRSSERPGTEEGRRGGLPPVGAPLVQVAPTVTGSVMPLTPPTATDETLVGREDRVDGTIRAHKTIRVLGSVKGKLYAPSVIIEEGARVTADISADDVVVAGEYSGTLVCRQRLEVRPTGRVSGRLETLKLMLLEGAVIDGEIHMVTPVVDDGTVRIPPSARGYSESIVRVPVGSNAGIGEQDA